MTTQEDIVKVCDGMQNLLIEKNRRYGDSALHPINIFSKLDGNEQIKIRLDDKLSRIINGSYSKNDLADVTGYLILLMISEEWTDFEDLID